MPRTSAGLLLYRETSAGIEVLLGHMGGPFWAAKDDGAWSIPKGEYGPDEDPIAAARREFAEELGSPAPEVALRSLGRTRASGGKIISVWAAGADFDAASAVSNTFELEWPPRSGRLQAFPEIDRADWFELAAARRKLVKSQQIFIDALTVMLTPGAQGPTASE